MFHYLFRTSLLSQLPQQKCHKYKCTYTNSVLSNCTALADLSDLKTVLELAPTPIIIEEDSNLSNPTSSHDQQMEDSTLPIHVLNALAELSRQRSTQEDMEFIEELVIDLHLYLILFKAHAVVLGLYLGLGSC